MAMNSSTEVTGLTPPPRGAVRPAGSLTAEQLSFFDANGYLVLEPFSSEEDVRALRDRMAALIAGTGGSNSAGSCEHHRVAMDDYYFKSGENISFFYEDKAFGDDGCLNHPKDLSVKMVGHGLWLALEDATINNGCLWAILGSHKNGMSTRMIKDEKGIYFDCPIPSYDHKEFVPLEVKSGCLVVLHGDLVHKSVKNLSPTSRHALVLHIVDTKGCERSKKNWLQREIAPKALYDS